MNKQRNIAIMIFDNVEVLDFAGPYEAFNVTADLNQPSPFNVYTVAETSAPIRTRGKMSVNPNYSIYGMPPVDILLIPGGYGTRAMLRKPHLIEWVKEQAEKVELLLSVCTGSLVLAKAGLLDDVEATTHHGNFPELEQLAPTCTVIKDRRYVTSGNIIMSGGVSAGIDMALHVVQQLCGNEILAKTLTEMEYPYTPDVDLKWPERIAALAE